MKKIIKFVFFAVVVGLLISGYYYNKLKKEFNVKTISIFQTGVYSNYEEASISSNSKNKIFYDGNFYHIYDSVVASKDAKEKMMKYYKNNNIEYYIKEKYVSINLYDDILKYSKLIELSDNKSIELINNVILEKYGDDII